MDAHVPWCAYGGQRTICENQVSPSTMWVPGFEWVSRLGVCVYLYAWVSGSRVRQDNLCYWTSTLYQVISAVCGCIHPAS